MVRDADWVVSRAKLAAEKLGFPWDARLERILRFSIAHPTTFKNVPRNKMSEVADVTTVEEERLDRYFATYVRAYHLARNVLEVAVPSPTTVADPAVEEVLKAFTDVSHDELEEVSEHHRASMMAENAVGNLLERYIAQSLEEKGWVWCCGDIVRSVDFIKDSVEQERLLQLKNRSNSENSSSSRVRVGTDIEKWFRIDARAGKTHWETLPDNDDSALTEEGFMDYIRESGAKLKVMVARGAMTKNPTWRDIDDTEEVANIAPSSTRPRRDEGDPDARGMRV